MEIIRDLSGGTKPSPINMYYSSDDDADGATARYRGSLCKMMDWDNAAGHMVTWAGETTALEALVGILGEAAPVNASTHNDKNSYLFNDAAYGATTKKIHPILPSSIIKAEYSRKDPAGTSNLDTNFTTTSATTITCGDSITVADTSIGGWVYFTNGPNENQLLYILDNDTNGVVTFANSTNGTVSATDDVIVVCPPHTRNLTVDATYTNLLSDIDDATRTLIVMGLGTYISAPGIPYQRLDRDKHDNLVIKNARFFHEFVIGGSATVGSMWRDVQVVA
jgi:hypothetical protein